MKRILIFIVVAAIALYAAAQFQPSGTDSTKVEDQSQSLEAINQEETMTDVTELQIEDTKVGEGAEAVKGSQITVHYVGTLTDGTKFDSSRDRGNPFTFTLGEGMVIQGWEQGFEGMKVGGMRKLTIPPAMAYGEQGVGSIPGNSTLLFEVELLDVQ